MATKSILANTVRPSVDHRSDDTAIGVGTFSWQDPVHSWKAGPGECMTVENKQTNKDCIVFATLRYVHILMFSWKIKYVNGQIVDRMHLCGTP